MFCPSCGASNDDEARVCNACGAALPQTGPAAPAPRTSSATAVTAVALVGLLLLAALGIGYLMARATPPLATGSPSAAGPQGKAQPAPTPVPATDAAAEAQVVLEKYLAADLGHAGHEMKQYLGGQAAARFVPEVQGQEDLTVHSETVAGHTVKDANTIVFAVAVQWSPEGSAETKTQTDRYVLKRTDAGWRITSTPAYPE